MNLKKKGCVMPDTKIIGDLEPIPYPQPKKYAKKNHISNKEEIRVSGWINDFSLQIVLNFSKQFNSIKSADSFMDKLIKKYPDGEYLISKETTSTYKLYTNL